MPRVNTIDVPSLEESMAKVFKSGREPILRNYLPLVRGTGC